MKDNHVSRMRTVFHFVALKRRHRSVCRRQRSSHCACRAEAYVIGRLASLLYSVFYFFCWLWLLFTNFTINRRKMKVNFLIWLILYRLIQVLKFCDMKKVRMILRISLRWEDEKVQRVDLSKMICQWVKE